LILLLHNGIVYMADSVTIERLIFYVYRFKQIQTSISSRSHYYRIWHP